MAKATKTKRVRGRPPGGEYPEKTAVMNFRTRPDTKRLLIEAARRSGRTLSQETEHQLRRALLGMGTGPTHAILTAVGSAIDGLIRMHHPVPERWTEDPVLFDQIVRAFTAAIEMFRPVGPIPQLVPHEQMEFDRLKGRAALLELLAQVEAADLSAPLAKRSARERGLAILKQDLDELTTRPAFGELIALAQKAAKNPADAEEKDARELWRFIGFLAAARRPS